MRQAISKREAIVQALMKNINVLGDSSIKDTSITVYRNLDKTQQIKSGGMIILRDNEAAKETDVLLNPLVYVYELTISLEIMVQHQDTDARSRLLDLLISMVGGVIDGNRTLNGLAEWCEIKPAEFHDEPIEGAATVRSAIVPVLVRFSSS